MFVTLYYWTTKLDVTSIQLELDSVAHPLVALTARPVALDRRYINTVIQFELKFLYSNCFVCKPSVLFEVA